MGTKRIGLARIEALMESLKRELSMVGSTVKLEQLDVYDSTDTYYHSIKTKIANLTLNTGAIEHDVVGFFPASCVPLALTATVTTAITNNAYVTNIGTDADGDVFGAVLADGVLEAAGTSQSFFGDLRANDTFFAADVLRITTNANPTGGGAVRITLTYIDPTGA